MTKTTNPQSLEHGIRRALAALGNQGVEEAIKQYLGFRRSASLIQKCGNPDDETHHLQLRYAIALDAACSKAGHAPPLMLAYRYLLEHEAGQDPTVDGEDGLVDAVLLLQSAIGELAWLVRENVKKNGDGADLWSRDNQQQLFQSIEAIEDDAEAIRRILLDHGGPDL